MLNKYKSDWKKIKNSESNREDIENVTHTSSWFDEINGKQKWKIFLSSILREMAIDWQ